jgi:hypothetical protein
LYYSGKYLYFNKNSKSYGNSYKTGDIITIIYDSSEGSLKFLINEIDQGVAIQNDQLKQGEYCITADLISQND